MAWVKLDDQFPDHPKVDRLSDGAFRLHVSGLCHAGRYLTDGLIPRDRPPRLMSAYRPKYLKELLDAGLWTVVDDGYCIHDFTEWNKTRAWWEEKRSKDAQRLAEWRTRNGVTNGVAADVSNDASNARPVPVPVPLSLVTSPSQSSLLELIGDDGLRRIEEATNTKGERALGIAETILDRAGSEVRRPLQYVLRSIAKEPALYVVKRGSPKRGEDCPTHVGEWPDNCRGCAADRIGGTA